jgi:hypothetical protein
MIQTMIRTPTQFFGTFADAQTNRNWFLSLAGYYLVSFVQGYSDLLDARPDMATLVALRRAGLSSLVWLPVVILLWAVLWLWLGARIFGGRPSLRTTTKVIGYALLVPGVLGALILGAALTAARTWVLAPPGVYVYLLASLGLAAWALTLCWKALRTTGGLSPRVTTAAFLWLPLLAITWIAVDEFVLH